MNAIKHFSADCRAERRMKLQPERFRMLIMSLISAALLVFLYFAQRQQIGVVALKELMITSAGVLGYYIDRTAFPYSRPSDFPDKDLRWRYEWRRAFIMVGAMIAVSLGA